MQTLTKKTNGNIILTHADGEEQLLSKYATLKIESADEILVQQTQGQSESIFLDGLVTEIEGTGAVSWGTTADDLVVFLSDNFFQDDLAAVLAAINFTNFASIAGNSIEVTYYAGVAAGNPSGATTNIETIVYKTGVTTIITKTITYNANNDIITITIS